MNGKDYFERCVARTISRHALLSVGKLYLVGLSGGADSVALVCCLKSLGYRIEAVHCNFELRGVESDRDEAFVRNFCVQQGILLHVRHFQTESYARKHHVSIEMAARDLRYDWFRTLSEERGASGIVVAHHRDDDAETVLMNMIRGTGIRGLCGMKYKHENILRPLLDVSREDIENYLMGLGQTYVTDSSNLENDVTRNKIRLDILPLLRAINPSVGQTLHELAKRMTDVELLYQKAVKEAVARVFRDGKIALRELRKEYGAESVLFEILAPMGFNSAQVSAIYEQTDHHVSGRIYESNDWMLLCDREYLICREKNGNIGELLTDELPDAGEISVTESMKFLITSHSADAYTIRKEKSFLCLDADKVRLPLHVRRWQMGDRFYPFGMKGSKLVSDYLTDCKKSKFEKNDQLVLVSGENLVWVVGERSDRRFSIDASTRRVLQIEIVKE